MRFLAAISPQAKSRIERAFLTLQDCLVKELRLETIATIEKGKLYLERKLLSRRKREFTLPGAASADAHRSIEGLDLRAILTTQTTRTVANDYTVRHRGRLYQIEHREMVRGLRSSWEILEEP